MAEPLQLNSVIGFGGSVDCGLLAHPDGRTLIYALGSTVVLRDKHDSRSQEFLQGHSDKVRAGAGPVLCVPGERQGRVVLGPRQGEAQRAPAREEARMSAYAASVLGKWGRRATTGCTASVHGIRKRGAEQHAARMRT